MNGLRWLVVSFVALLALPAAAASSSGAAWLFDPLQVNAIDLSVTPSALASLRDEPRSYVDARITVHHGSASFGPYDVRLKLKGHSSFRDLDAKAAFKVKFDREFQGLKELTLNNMVQDPSMIAEAASSAFLRAIGLPASRVGYAWVRVNGEVFGLYTNVETVDKVMTKRWFASTRHIYEANYTDDVIPGGAGKFDVGSGPSKDVSDLERLIAATSGDTPGWADRMRPVADLPEFARVFAAEHYMGQFDGYSYGSTQAQPNNYDLVSDDSGRFSIVVTGTDQTWLEGPNFGLTGNGVLFRECLASAGCQPLYMTALRQIAGNRQVAGLAATAAAIRRAIAPWRVRDPRQEQSVADGEAQAAAKIAFIASRRAQLERWLDGPGR
jgi:hypothetical protein